MKEQFVFTLKRQPLLEAMNDKKPKADRINRLSAVIDCACFCTGSQTRDSAAERPVSR
jgi:hypothetical protein